VAIRSARNRPKNVSLLGGQPEVLGGYVSLTITGKNYSLNILIFVFWKEKVRRCGLNGGRH
jgi:hypothetical protein